MGSAMSAEKEIAALRAQLAERDAIIAEQAAILSERDLRLAAATLEIEKMRMQLALLRRQQFGRSSERLEGAAAQFELRLEALEEDFAAEEAEHESDSLARPASARRAAIEHRPLPAHLPLTIARSFTSSNPVPRPTA
jgi:transposase